MDYEPGSMDYPESMARQNDQSNKLCLGSIGIVHSQEKLAIVPPLKSLKIFGVTSRMVFCSDGCEELQYEMTHLIFTTNI